MRTLVYTTAAVKRCRANCHYLTTFSACLPVCVAATHGWRTTTLPPVTTSSYTGCRSSTCGAFSRAHGMTWYAAWPCAGVRACVPIHHACAHLTWHQPATLRGCFACQHAHHLLPHTHPTLLQTRRTVHEAILPFHCPLCAATTYATWQGRRRIRKRRTSAWRYAP